MTRSARIGFLLAAVAVLVIAFVVIGTGSDDDAGEGTVGPVGTAAQQQPSDGGTTEAEPADTAEPEPTPEPTPVVRAKGGEPVGGVQEIEVDKGERVRFAVKSDTEDEVHVHGYDRYVDVGPDKPGRIAFTADADGIYEVELHGTATQIAELRVNP